MKMKNKDTETKTPVVLFDSLQYVENTRPNFEKNKWMLSEYNYALAFLKSYKGSRGTFNAYRREIERLLQWSWHIQKKPVKKLKREDIEELINFCKNPPKTWIGVNKVPRFIEKDGVRLPNAEWRPFVVTISKSEHRKGNNPKIKNFELLDDTIKEMFSILSSFFNYLLQEEYITANPISLMRQKSKFIRKQQGLIKIRRLSELQWEYLMTAALHMAENDPNTHERTLFIISTLYAMYLRISELAANDRWIPLMNNFHKDHDGNWWFITVGKGNKERKIAVSNAMLKALKRWRKHLNLPALPSVSDKTPLLPKTKGKGPISSVNYIRRIVQGCFDSAIEQLNNDGFVEEAESLISATVHWLRHTGISDDVKRRPREHVRDDAGHSSSAITDKYIDIELRERHRSAKNKPILDVN
jgi:site-specific recombinase XerD